MSERGREGDEPRGALKDAARPGGFYVPPKDAGELTSLRERIIARFDAKTGSNSAATHGPLIAAILEELFPVPDEPAGRQEAP